MDKEALTISEERLTEGKTKREVFRQALEPPPAPNSLKLSMIAHPTQGSPF